MSIKVLTLNMWGVPFVSKRTKERSKYLIAHLLESDYDIVGLQEVFVSWHAKLITEGVKAIYGHSHWYRSGSLGSPGLLVLSRYPIIEVGFHNFTLNGYPQHIHHGDWWAGKGVGLCRIDHPITMVDFYVTHLHANYVHTGNDPTAGHRVSQMFNMAKFISQSARSHAVLAVGDFNSKEDEIPTRVFVEASGLTDSYRELYPDPVSHPGYTNDAPECSWRSETATAALCSNDKIKRIDYIFYNDDYLSCNDSQVTCGTIPGKEFSYSDHMGVASTFIINHTAHSVTNKIFRLTKSTSDAAVRYLDGSIQHAYTDTKQKLVIWFMLMLLWVVVVVLGGLGYLSAVVVGVVSSCLAAMATAVFWYLILFCRLEVAKFVEARNEMAIINRFSE